MKKILIILVVLIVIALLLSQLLHKQQSLPAGILQITGPAGDEHTFTSFPDNQSLSLKTAKGDFQVVPVSAFLGRHINNENWQQLTFYSSDGAEITVKRTELPALYLTQISDSEKSYLRLIVPSDDFAQRWLKYINRIVLQ
ncbi:MAG: hypothetical protein K9N06_10430 [Candidatus Cloacimonetes bacterium]|nr:hypothetical protein [Candidatus Cloacimonadota bacterium]